VEAVLAETDDRVTAAAVLARVGGPKKGKQDNSRKRESLGKGQTRDYTLARLPRRSRDGCPCRAAPAVDVI
jgi:hypothetical protein